MKNVDNDLLEIGMFDANGTLEEEGDYDYPDYGTGVVIETELQNGYSVHYNPYNGMYEV